MPGHHFLVDQFPREKAGWGQGWDPLRGIRRLPRVIQAENECMVITAVIIV